MYCVSAGNKYSLSYYVPTRVTVNHVILLRQPSVLLFCGVNTTEASDGTCDMQLVNCYFCGDSSQPHLMFPIDGANSAICGECLVETVHKAWIIDTLIRRLDELGVTMSTNGEHLELRPGSRVPQDLHDEIRRHKLDLIDRLPPRTPR